MCCVWWLPVVGNPLRTIKSCCMRPLTSPPSSNLTHIFTTCPVSRPAPQIKTQMKRHVGVLMDTKGPEVRPEDSSG